MKCVLCNKEIEKKVDTTGKVYWSTGNNASPLNDGRCCDFCNETKVIPERIRRLKL